jgi:hypothetical protein
MSRYVYQGNFIAPPERREYPDGRNRCDKALKKLFSRGPTRPDSLAKRATPDADVAAEAAMLLTKHERRLRSNAHETLEAVKKVHRSGRRAGFPEHEAQGDEEFRSRSVSAIRKARGHAVHVSGHRMLGARELNKAFADSIGKVEVNLDGIEPHRGYASGFRAMTKLEKRAFRKGLTGPALNDIGTKPPNSANANWNDVHADTGATNDWRDQSVPNVKPTLVGGQPIGAPPITDRDAALDAIKRALRKPEKMWGNNSDMDQDQTEDLDEDDADDDEDESRGKDPNAADSFDGNRSSRKRKQRADEE